MFNDYGLANIAWQRQQEAEREAAAHRLAVLAQRGSREAAILDPRRSFVSALVRRVAQVIGVVKDLGLLSQYAAEAERLHREVRRRPV